MDITSEMLLERRKQMEAEKQQCVNQANALHGAIIDIEHWLAVLEQAETPTDADQGEPDALEETAEGNDGGQDDTGGNDGEEN